MSRPLKASERREMRLQPEIPVSVLVVSKLAQQRGAANDSSLPPGGPARHCSQRLQLQLTVSKAFTNHISSPRSVLLPTTSFPCYPALQLGKARQENSLRLFCKETAHKSESKQWFSVIRDSHRVDGRAACLFTSIFPTPS